MKNATRTGSQILAPALGVLVCTYFICPYLYLLPFLLVYGKHTEPPAYLLTCFWPVEYLYQHYPPYHSLMDKEERLFGLR